jgi:6-phospho-beta-glucosidase
MHPMPQTPLAPELLGLVQHVAAYERLAVAAAVTRDPSVARKALLAHPLIGQVEMVDELVERLLAAEVPT